MADIYWPGEGYSLWRSSVFTFRICNIYILEYVTGRLVMTTPPVKTASIGYFGVVVLTILTVENKFP